MIYNLFSYVSYFIFPFDLTDFYFVILCYSNYLNRLESELKRTDKVELIDGPLDSDEDDETVDDIDYDGTEDDTNTSSSTSNYYPINDCRGGDVVECPGNPNHKICEVQMCDGM